MCVWLAALVFSSVSPGQPAQLDAWPVTAEQVDRAIAAMRAYLVSKQDPASGRWPGRYDTGAYDAGRSTLALLALIESGVPAQDPVIARGLEAVKRVPMDHTYTRSLRAQLYAKLPDGHAAALRRDIQWLSAQQDGGGFAYRARQRGSGAWDQSNTHFGVLGLAAYEHRGTQFSRRAWAAISRHQLEHQNQDGGWGYHAGGASSAAMTAAGLTGLLSARWSLERTRDQADAEVAEAVERGFAYLAAHLDAVSPTGGGGHGLYGLLAIERCLLWDGRTRIGGQDWFRRYAQEILRSMNNDGSIGDGVIDTSYALIFLARGRVPVWISKLRLPRQAWNNRPNDLNRFTRRLSDWREAELGWQVVSIQDNPLRWLNAPVLYLSIDAPLTLDPDELDAIRRYLDLGGLLVVNAETGRRPHEASERRQEIIDSVQELMARIYPALTWSPAEASHPLMALVLASADERRAEQAPLLAHNGARDLVVVLPDDYGQLMQADHDTRLAQAARALMTNLYAWATNRGRDRPRLSTPLVEPMHPMPTRTIRVVRAVPAGYEPTEWYAWTPFLARFQWVADRTVRLSKLPLERIGSVEAALVHLPGTQAIGLSEAELQAMEAYVQRGGTILLETVGGRGDFARSVSEQLALRLGPAQRLAAEDPLIAGEVPGAMDRSSVAFQHFTALHFPFRGVPRMLVHRVGERPAVLVSNLDLSLALMGLNRYGVHGYSSESARGLLVNILLFAEHATAPPPE